MSLRARIERLLSPGIGCCLRCERPWRCPATRRVGPRARQQLRHDRFVGFVGVKEHTTNYRQSRGCFALCEGCWASLTPSARLPFYDELFTLWGADDDRALIHAAVLAGN